jgi:SnoaL-like domain
MTTDPDVQELLDKQRLADNLMTYCRGVDRGDIDLVRSVYWPEAVDDHGAFIGSGLEFSEFVANFRDNVYNANHHVTNILSEIEGERAKRESMFLFVTSFKAPAVTLFLGGRYRDLCERRHGVWKILTRTCVWDWSEQRQTRHAWDLSGVPEVANWGRWYPHDPIHADWAVAAPTRNPRPNGVPFAGAPKA